MNAGPFSSSKSVSASLPGGVPTELDQSAASPTVLKWSALHDTAGIVAVLAGLAPEPFKPQVRNFPALIRDAGGWRTALAEQGIDDLAAMMEPGIAALLAVHARGASCGAAALALWQEFVRARTALLALASPAGARMLGPG